MATLQRPARPLLAHLMLRFETSDSLVMVTLPQIYPVLSPLRRLIMRCWAGFAKAMARRLWVTRPWPLLAQTLRFWRTRMA